MKFTIVVPSFNHGPYLEDCLDSILMQRGIDKEIILMDGGSTDGSLDIVRRYETHLAYWQSQPDGGQAAALNAGFARASGDVYGWLCSDDFLLPGALAAALQALEAHRADIVSGACLFFADNGVEHEIRRPSDVLQRDLRLICHVAQPSCFWRRHVWDGSGPLDATMYRMFDWDLWLTMRERGFSWVTTDRVLSAFRFHGGNKTMTINAAAAEEQERLYDRHLPPELKAMRSRIRSNASGYLCRLHAWSSRLGIDPLWVYKSYSRVVLRGLPTGLHRDLLMTCGIYYGDDRFYLGFPTRPSSVSR